MELNNLIEGSNEPNVKNLSDITDNDFVISLDTNSLQNQQQNTFDNNDYQNNIDNVNQDPDPNVDPNLDPNKDNKDDDQKKSEEEDDLVDYSPMSLTALALAEEGFNFFGEEIPKDLKARDFVDNFKNFTTNYLQNQVNQLGEIAKYVKYKIETGGEIEDLSPALELEQYINYDINNPEVDEEDLEIIVRAMYTRQVADVSLVDGLIEADKNKNQLYDKAVKAKQFLAGYRDQLIEQANANYKNNQLLEQQRVREESSAFAGALSQLDNIAGVKITDNERSQLFDMMYKKDKLVTIQDPNTGQLQQDYLTEYDLAIYNTVNDPVRLAKLLYFLKNDFNLTKVENQIQRKSNKSLLEMLDSGKNKVSNIPNTNINGNIRDEEELINIML